ncbi:MAG: phytanoyl-CoA dioxygenase family protein [Henriciella sp.]|nr:phytanoyl-CoA dioxygenase family protein [Henriciella sp.]
MVQSFKWMAVGPHNKKADQMTRHTQAQVDEWRNEGAILLDQFLTPDEIKPCFDDMRALYGKRTPDQMVERKDDHHGQVGTFSMDQFRNNEDMPFDCSPALNLLGLSPTLIAMAKDALGTDDVRLYQSHTWAKYTGTADYEQPFHCDFKNHTLTVPSEDAIGRTINFMIYLTDVTENHGAISYVPLSDSDPITGPNREMFLDTDIETQHRLKQVEKRGVGKAGSVFAYGIDVYHRGMNLTVPDGCRYTLTASYKAAGNDMIGWSAWPHSFMKPWHLLIDNADPEQLACLGIPRPGDPFWTPRTIERAKLRWPNWNMDPYEHRTRA